MRTPRDDDHDIRMLVEHASNSWRGPSPGADQARWAADAERGHWVRTGLTAAGCGAAVFLAGSLVLLATSPSRDGAAVVNLMSHVFTTPPPASPAASPAPSPPISAPPVPAGAPTPTQAVRPATRPARTPTPWPERSGGPDYRWPSPTPSPMGSPSPGPSPSPSPTDE